MVLFGGEDGGYSRTMGGKPLSLHMGYVDDEDITYFNGIEIGSTKGYTHSRTYEIPGNLVKKRAKL